MYWLIVIRQQTIIWAYVDPDICRHMALLSHNELMVWHGMGDAMMTWRHGNRNNLCQVRGLIFIMNTCLDMYNFNSRYTLFPGFNLLYE